MLGNTDAMTDFWLAFALTAIVSIFAVLTDWLTSRLVYYAATFRRLRSIKRSGLSKADAYDSIYEEIDRYDALETRLLSWGADLAVVALSLDLAALGVWIHTPSFFPFFQRFNTEAVSREIPLWLVLIGMHVLILVISLTLKHAHRPSSRTRAAPLIGDAPRMNWLGENGWMLGANSAGFVALFSALVVFTDAL